MSTYIKTLKEGNDQILPRTRTEAIKHGSSDLDSVVDGILTGKQDKLTAGTNITIDENNVISATGEPDAYLKNATTSGNTLTLTKKDDSTVNFTPEEVAVVNGTTPTYSTIWIDTSKNYGEIEPTQIVQTTGQATDKVMSQKAVTDSLDTKVDSDSTTYTALSNAAANNGIGTVTSSPNYVVAKWNGVDEGQTFNFGWQTFIKLNATPVYEALVKYGAIQESSTNATFKFKKGCAKLNNYESYNEFSPIFETTDNKVFYDKTTSSSILYAVEAGEFQGTAVPAGLWTAYDRGMSQVEFYVPGEVTKINPELISGDGLGYAVLPEEQKSYSWDGQTTGRPTVTYNDKTYVKIADTVAIPKYNRKLLWADDIEVEFTNLLVTINTGYTFNIAGAVELEGSDRVYIDFNENAIFVFEDSQVTIGSTTFTKGLWIFYDSSSSEYISNISYTSQGVYSKIDSRYLPTDGELNFAYGKNSHAEGYGTQAMGENSHAQNLATTADGENQTVLGKYNETDNSKAVIIGNGTTNDSRSNALTVDWNGNVNASGNIQAAGLTDGNTTKTMTEILSAGSFPHIYQHNLNFYGQIWYGGGTIRNCNFTCTLVNTTATSMAGTQLATLMNSGIGLTNISISGVVYEGDPTQTASDYTHIYRIARWEDTQFRLFYGAPGGAAYFPANNTTLDALFSTDAVVQII